MSSDATVAERAESTLASASSRRVSSVDVLAVCCGARVLHQRRLWTIFFVPGRSVFAAYATMSELRDSSNPCPTPALVGITIVLHRRDRTLLGVPCVRHRPRDCSSSPSHPWKASLRLQWPSTRRSAIA